MIDRQIIGPCCRIGPHLVANVLLTKRSSDLVQRDVRRVSTPDTSWKSRHSIFRFTTSQVGRTLRHLHEPRVQKFRAICSERMEKTAMHIATYFGGLFDVVKSPPPAQIPK